MQFAFTEEISPHQEVLAYEKIWAYPGMTEKKVTQLFDGAPLPSKVASGLDIPRKLHEEVEAYLDTKMGQFATCVSGDFQYPSRLRDDRNPVNLFYYKGELAFTETPSISIVGARAASPEGLRRAEKLGALLSHKGYTIISGIAEGIDTVALSGAIKAKGRVIGVIGTPIDQYYPKKNKALQDEIAKNHLLISQVPFYRYDNEPFSSRKFYFPRRNATMSALSQATVIVEASEKSGTLTQARAAIAQGRKLFILNSCFENEKITWPKYYEAKGAIRVKDIDDITSHLPPIENAGHE